MPPLRWRFCPETSLSRSFCSFPEPKPSALEDKDVELRTQVGPFKIKRKFKLKNMVFNDKLEL